MQEENRTDLPHDQVAQDNDGELNATDIDLLDPIRNVANDVGGDNGLLATPDDLNEETATEVAPNIRNINGADNQNNGVNDDQIRNIETMEENETANTALGWTALVLSIISLFFLPILTASVGIITGFFAIRNGARTLGIWAIAISIFSMILSLIIMPFIR